MDRTHTIEEELQHQVATQSCMVAAAKVELAKMESDLATLQEALQKVQRRREEEQRQAEAARLAKEAARLAAEAAEKARQLPDLQLAYVKRCWKYLVKHRELRQRRDKANRDSFYFDPWARRSCYTRKSYDEYVGEWNPVRHPPAQVIRAAHACHYMGLLRQKVGRYHDLDYSYEGLESAYQAGEMTLGKLNYNNRDCGWHISTVGPAMATWPNEYDFSIDSGPKEHSDTFFAHNAGPSYD